MTAALKNAPPGLVLDPLPGENAPPGLVLDPLPTEVPQPGAKVAQAAPQPVAEAPPVVNPAPGLPMPPQYTMTTAQREGAWTEPIPHPADVTEQDRQAYQVFRQGVRSLPRTAEGIVDVERLTPEQSRFLDLGEQYEKFAGPEKMKRLEYEQVEGEAQAKANRAMNLPSRQVGTTPGDIITGMAEEGFARGYGAMGGVGVGAWNTSIKLLQDCLAAATAMRQAAIPPQVEAGAMQAAKAAAATLGASPDAVKQLDSAMKLAQSLSTENLGRVLERGKYTAPPGTKTEAMGRQVGGFAVRMAEFVYGLKLIGKAFGAFLGPGLKTQIAAFETHSQIHGGQPGEGAAMAAGLWAFGKLPVRDFVKLALESTAFAALAVPGAAAGPSEPGGSAMLDVFLNASMPLILRMGKVNPDSLAGKLKAAKGRAQQLRVLEEGFREGVATAAQEREARRREFTEGPAALQARAERPVAKETIPPETGRKVSEPKVAQPVVSEKPPERKPAVSPAPETPPIQELRGPEQRATVQAKAAAIPRPDIPVDLTVLSETEYGTLRKKVADWADAVDKVSAYPERTWQESQDAWGEISFERWRRDLRDVHPESLTRDWRDLVGALPQQPERLGGRSLDWMRRIKAIQDELARQGTSIDENVFAERMRRDADWKEVDTDTLQKAINWGLIRPTGRAAKALPAPAPSAERPTERPPVQTPAKPEASQGPNAPVNPVANIGDAVWYEGPGAATSYGTVLSIRNVDFFGNGVRTNMYKVRTAYDVRDIFEDAIYSKSTVPGERPIEVRKPSPAQPEPPAKPIKTTPARAELLKKPLAELQNIAADMGWDVGRMRRGSIPYWVDRILEGQPKATPAATEAPAPYSPREAVLANLPDNAFRLRGIAKDFGIDVADIKGPGTIERLKTRIREKYPTEPAPAPETLGLRPIRSRPVRPTTWRGNVAEPGKYVTDGFIVFPTSRLKSPEVAKRLAGPAARVALTPERADELWQESIKDATMPAEILGWRATPKQGAGFSTIPAYVKTQSGVVMVLDVDKLRLVENAVGGWDGVLVHPERPTGRPIVFTRKGKPVAAMMGTSFEPDADIAAAYGKPTKPVMAKPVPTKRPIVPEKGTEAAFPPTRAEAPARKPESVPRRAAEEPSGAPTGAAKEPWRTTAQGAWNAAEPIARGGLPVGSPVGDQYRSYHKMQVLMAIESGKPVPRAVLQDYASEPWAKEALAKAAPEAEKWLQEKLAAPGREVPTAPKAEAPAKPPRGLKARLEGILTPPAEAAFPPTRAEAPARKPESVPRRAAEEPSGAPTGAGKEPWEMTLEQYRQEVFDRRQQPTRFGKPVPAGRAYLRQGEVGFGTVVEKATGKRYAYNTKIAWGKRYYSFDDEFSWHKTKSEALRAAVATGKAREAAAPSADLARLNHKLLVESALHLGKPVPRAVLQEYASEPWAKEALAKAAPEAAKGEAGYVEGEGKTPTAPGFAALPGKGEAPPETVIETGPDRKIRLQEKPRDINIVQRNLDLGDTARATKDPDIIKPAEDLLDREMQMRGAIGKQTDRGRFLLKRVPRRERGALFGLVENGESPEQIRKRTDLSDATKEAVASAKEVHEAQRQYIIEDKRAMWAKVFVGPDVHLAAKLSEAGIDLGEKWTTKQAGEALAKWMVPNDWGRKWAYMPHLFFGDYRLTATIGGKPQFVGRAKTQNEAVLKLMEYRAAHPEAAGFRADPDLVFPSDMVRLSRGRMSVLRSQLKKAALLTSQEVSDAVRGVVGLRQFKQKWYGALQRRAGMEGYLKDFRGAYETGVRQFQRWKGLTELNRTLQPQLEALRAKGLSGWADHIQARFDNVWGKPGPVTIAFDNLVAKIPVLNKYVRPLALDRWASMVTGAQYYGKLTTPRFYVVNTLQPEQTLAPLVGYKRVEAGRVLYHSKQGQAILAEEAPAFASAWKEGPAPRGVMKWMPQSTSEKRNLGTAYLTMRAYGLEQGMSLPEAQRYARLMGVLKTQFYPLAADTPNWLRNPAGRIVFQFKRFQLKNLQLASSLLRDHNYTGFARWAGSQIALGGLNIALRQLGMGVLFAGWDKARKFKKGLEDTFGERIADGIWYGLPGLLGLDIGSSIQAVDMPYGGNVYEMVGRTLAGPTVGDIVAISEAAADRKAPETRAWKRVVWTVMEKNRALSLLDIALRNILGDDAVYSDPRGRPRYTEKPLPAWSRILKAAAFRTTPESNYRLWIEAMREVGQEYDKTLDSAVAAHLEGKTEKVKGILDRWRQFYPDIPMTGQDVIRRVKRREETSKEGAGSRLPVRESIKRHVGPP